MRPSWWQKLENCWEVGKKCHERAARLVNEGLIQEQARVVRGGSWNNNRNNARCSYRNRNEPDNFNNNIGFRVVCSTSLCFDCQKCGAVKNCSAEALDDG
jgi:formylglycine-generating enzyme required for sulfatase activity